MKTTLLVLLAALAEAGLLISPAFAYQHTFGGMLGGSIPLEAIWPLIIVATATVFVLMYLGKKREKKRKKRKLF